MEEIARIYATSLFQAAEGRGKIDSIKSQLEQFTDGYFQDVGLLFVQGTGEGGSVVPPGPVRSLNFSPLAGLRPGPCAKRWPR